jgi:N-terminal domain of toast_rack, DUF2154
MKPNYRSITLILFAALLAASCSSRARVGALQTESQSVELRDAESVQVEINMGAGNLDVTAGADNLLEADFTYNVAKLKPQVKYTDGTLIVWQPSSKGLPAFQGITDYRNEWGLRLSDEVPMDLRVNLGAGTSNLKLAGLSLTGLDVILGAGEYMIDLSGDWIRDLHVSIDTGAANIRLRLPKDLGVRVQVEAGPHTIEATDLTQDGDVYTNAAYGVSDVTMQVDIETGIGQINLEVEDEAATDTSPVKGELSQLNH